MTSVAGPLHISSPVSASPVLFALVASLLLLSQLTFAAPTTRSPLSAPIGDIDFKRELLAGSEALLERMVIPPDRPDWVVLDCAGPSDTATVFDNVRDSLCELKHN